MGLAMGTTAIGIIYSPWGKQSGAHINPATTLAFYRLGNVAGWDAVYYIVAQFCGALLGAAAAVLLLAPYPAHAAVNYVITLPGPSGNLAALVAEFAISFLLMTIILHVSNNARSQNFTGLCAGALVAVYITVEAPLSGMSMNPARSLASAVPAKQWADLWIYFTAPPIGMLTAAEVFMRRRGAPSVGCAKLHHDNPKRCIFCGKPALG
jgi:aquaporin Z